MKLALKEARDAYEQVFGDLRVGDDVKADIIEKLAVTLYIQSEGIPKRAESVREEPTPKQINYVSDLCKQLDIPETELHGMSKVEVSELIEKLKGRLKKG